MSLLESEKAMVASTPGKGEGVPEGLTKKRSMDMVESYLSCGQGLSNALKNLVTISWKLVEFDQSGCEYLSEKGKIISSGCWL